MNLIQTIRLLDLLRFLPSGALKGVLGNHHSPSAGHRHIEGSKMAAPLPTEVCGNMIQLTRVLMM